MKRCESVIIADGEDGMTSQHLFSRGGIRYDAGLCWLSGNSCRWTYRMMDSARSDVANNWNP